MTHSTTPTRLLARGLCFGGLACLAVITLASPGATRMFAWPWILAYAGALVAPALALVVRTLDREQPLFLPARTWWVAALVFATVVIASALTSPYRGPSVLGSAPLLGGVAVFFLMFDWLQRDHDRRDRLMQTILVASAVIAPASMILWAGQEHDAGKMLEARNPFPLGHSNYTAGLALLMLPVGVVAAVRRRGAWRGLAFAVVALALAMLFTSGSRGGFVGLAALVAAALWRAPLSARKKWQLTAAAALATVGFAFAHPRTRATLLGGAAARLVAASEVQRSAMFTAGWRLGADRPLLGWGPGTTPLAYPRYRGGLAGGAEIVLQLHSLPVQVWAELGAGGLACLLAFGVLTLRHAARHPTAIVTLLGYAAFSLTDWQLDVPVFTLALATLAALLAPPESCHLLGDKIDPRPRRVGGWLVGALALGGVAVVMLVGQRDPAPELNVRALALARDSAQADRAIALLRGSLTLNPDQEIAHFNLGWLLVVRDPASAEKHFHTAARLVPDKGGVYFGLGLARLNQGRAAAAAHAFALECLNDPRFLTSPWWREPAIAATREASSAAFGDLLRRLAGTAPPHALDPGQLGRVPDGPGLAYRRERTGYPVLMRNLDLPTPQDLYDVRESTASANPGVRLPPKGWLPSPLLLTLLDTPNSTKP